MVDGRVQDGESVSLSCLRHCYSHQYWAPLRRYGRQRFEFKTRDKHGSNCGKPWRCGPAMSPAAQASSRLLAKPKAYYFAMWEEQPKKGKGMEKEKRKKKQSFDFNTKYDPNKDRMTAEEFESSNAVIHRIAGKTTHSVIESAANLSFSQSKLSQDELAQLMKSTHFDKKELQQWYKGMSNRTLRPLWQSPILMMV